MIVFIDSVWQNASIFPGYLTTNLAQKIGLHLDWQVYLQKVLDFLQYDKPSVAKVWHSKFLQNIRNVLFTFKNRNISNIKLKFPYFWPNYIAYPVDSQPFWVLKSIDLLRLIVVSQCPSHHISISVCLHEMLFVVVHWHIST